MTSVAAAARREIKQKQNCGGADEAKDRVGRNLPQVVAHPARSVVHTGFRCRLAVGTALPPLASRGRREPHSSSTELHLH
jgi:hypothetical protein